RRGRDVERAGVVAAGAARVEQRSAPRADRSDAAPQRLRHAGDLVGGLPLHAHRHGEGADLSGRRVAGEDLLHGGAGQVEWQVLAQDGTADRGLDQRATLLCWRHNVRKFSISWSPGRVSTDSGWNWTPHVSWSLCLSAMISPSGVHATISSTSGSDG